MTTLTKEQAGQKLQLLQQKAEEMCALTKELAEAGVIKLSEEDLEKVSGGDIRILPGGDIDVYVPKSLYPAVFRPKDTSGPEPEAILPPQR